MLIKVSNARMTDEALNYLFPTLHTTDADWTQIALDPNTFNKINACTWAPKDNKYSVTGARKVSVTLTVQDGLKNANPNAIVYINGESFDLDRLKSPVVLNLRNCNPKIEIHWNSTLIEKFIFDVL